MSFFVMATWSFIQSEYFGKILAKEVNETISSQTDFDITFSHIEIEMFPPTTSLKNVKARNKERSVYEIDIVAGGLSLAFGISDFFSSKLSIDQVGFEDAKINFKLNKPNTNSKDSIEYSSIFPLIKNILTEDLPVSIKGVHLKRSTVYSKLASGYFEYLDATLYKNVLETNIKAHNLEVSEVLVPDNNYRKFDFLSLDFHLNSKKLLIKNSELWKDTQKLSLDGALIFKPLRNIDFAGSVYLRGLIEKNEYVKNNIELSKLNISGVYEVKADVVTNLNEVKSVDGSIRIVDLKSEYANVDSLFTRFDVKDSILSIENTYVEHNNGSAELFNRVGVFNLKTKELLRNTLNAKIKNLHTNSMLFALRDSLDILKGRATGNVDILWDGKDVTFSIYEGAKFESFKLALPKTTPILENKYIKINSGVVKILNEGVSLDFDLATGESTKIRATALLSSERIDVDVSDSFIDFEELGPISGLQLKGSGPFDMVIKGITDDVNFDFDVDLKNAEILGYNLENFKSQLTLDLEELVLTIKNGKGVAKGSRYLADGYLDFKRDKLNISVNMLYSDLKSSLYILKPILKDLSFLHVPYLSYSYKAQVKISGGINPDDLIVYGLVEGVDLQILREKSESLSFNFNYANNLLTFDQIKLRHGSAEAVGKFNMNLKSQYFEYDAKLFNGHLEDLEVYRFLDLGYASEVSGEFYGKGTLDDFSTRSHLKFTNSFLGNVQVPESLLTIYNNSKEVFSSGNLLGDRATYNMYLNFDKNTTQKSYFNSFINFKDIRELVGILSNHNMETKDISGFLKSNISSSFSVFDLKNSSVSMKMSEFKFNKGSKELFIDGEEAFLHVVNGSLDKVQVSLKSNESDFFKIEGKGSLGEELILEQKFKVDASLLELFSRNISKTTGYLSGQGRIYGNINNFDFDQSVSGENIFLKLSNVPTSFSGMNFNLVIDENSIFLNELSGFFGKGNVNGNGVVKLVLPYPEVDLAFEFKNSYLPLFKKSGVLLSGKGKLEGNKFPYLLNGSVTVLNGTINDELQDLSPPSVKGDQVHEKYVPENKYKSNFDYFDLDILLDFDKPVIVRNLLTDLRLVGNGRIRGKPYKPELNGIVEVVPGLSKLLFKGNEFIIKEGSLTFTEEKGLVPELNFNGSSRINQYSINLDLYGMANDPQLSVSSDPFLNQEDIFSLLTLGFTSEISDELEEKDLRSATTLGIGTLLFDQLLKNQGLSSKLGLKLSVLPEFQEDESSLLKGKSGVSDTGSSRYKTATKIKLEKKLSRNVDLSLSSTVGGSAEQKQEMNINYNVLKNVSLEGVYEVNNGDEEQYQEPTSFGVDFKIQWSY